MNGFNQRQISDIFSILLSNTNDKGNINLKKEEEKYQSIQINNNINNNIINNDNNDNIDNIDTYKNIKIKYMQSKRITTNSKDNILYNNAVLAKTENSEIKINKRNSKCNYMKININAFSEKTRGSNLNNKTNEPRNKHIKNKIKINNIPYNNKYFKMQNNSYSQKNNNTVRNDMIGNYLKKYNSQNIKGNIIYTGKKIEDNKKQIIKKIVKEKNINNYKNSKKIISNNKSNNNFKRIDINKKELKGNKETKKAIRKKINNPNCLEIKNDCKSNDRFKFIKKRNKSFSEQKNKENLNDQINSELKRENEFKEDLYIAKINLLKSDNLKDNKNTLMNNKSENNNKQEKKNNEETIIESKNNIITTEKEKKEKDVIEHKNPQENDLIEEHYTNKEINKNNEIIEKEK